MSEFQLFDRIINGDLRPHLKAYSDDAGLAALEKEFFSVEVQVTGELPEQLLQHFPAFAATFREGDEVKITIDQDGEVPQITLSAIPNESAEDLINIDIPPPPDAKSELFLDIITLEYERLHRAFVKGFEAATDAQSIIFYATRNIQLAKRIARDAFLLKKQLQRSGVDDWENPNTFIVEAVKKHLIYLITELQQLFHPFNHLPVQNEPELEDELFDGHHLLMQARIEVMSKQLNTRYLEKIYGELGDRPTLQQKRELIEQQLADRSAQIAKRQKEGGLTSRHDFDIKRLLESELGIILSDIYTEKMLAPSITGLLEKYEKGLQLITTLRLDGRSAAYRALAKTDFFSRAQYQLNTWKELIQVSYHAPVRENIFKDLENTLITIQTRKHLQLSEDQWNDYICDLLRAQKYYIADQSRSGASGGRAKLSQSGELDITIRDAGNNGNIKTIIETMKIDSCGEQNKQIAMHLEKLLNRYDTAGNPESYFVILSYAKRFQDNWAAYQAYFNRIYDNAETPIKPISPDPTRSEIRLAYSLIPRSGQLLRLYHLFVNMHTDQSTGI